MQRFAGGGLQRPSFILPCNFRLRASRAGRWGSERSHTQHDRRHGRSASFFEASTAPGTASERFVNGNGSGTVDGDKEAAEVYPEEQQRWIRIHEEEENLVRPRYNKYRSQTDVAKDYVKQWKRVTRRGVPRHKMSILSVIRFFPGWVKYYVIPQPFRYLWYLVWSRAVEAHHAYHKWACLQGAKLDEYLLALSGRGGSFSRQLVLQRYHYKVSGRETLSYRYRLLKEAYELWRGTSSTGASKAAV